MTPSLRQKACFIWNSNKIEGLATPSVQHTLDIIKDYMRERDTYEKSLMKKHFKYVIPHYLALEYVLNVYSFTKPKWLDVLYIHEKLMEGQLYSHQRGHLRDCQVYIGNHVPPAPGAKLMAYVEKFVRWLERLDDPSIGRQELYGLIYDSHCEFEALHPFVDGNGRSGRLFWLAFLNYHGFEFNEIDYADQQIYYRSLNQRRPDQFGEPQDPATWWYPPRPYADPIKEQCENFQESALNDKK